MGPKALLCLLNSVAAKFDNDSRPILRKKSKLLWFPDFPNCRNRSLNCSYRAGNYPEKWLADGGVFFLTGTSQTILVPFFAPELILTVPPKTLARYLMM